MLEGLVVGYGRDRKEGHKGKESGAGGTEEGGRQEGRGAEWVRGHYGN